MGSPDGQLDGETERFRRAFDISLDQEIAMFKRGFDPEREREHLWSTLVRAVERNAAFDKHVAARFAAGDADFAEKLKRGAERLPEVLQIVNGIVLTVRVNSPSAPTLVRKGIERLERLGFYSALFHERHPIAFMGAVFLLHRIEDAFDDAIDDAGKIEDPGAREKARKGLRRLRDKHLRARSRGARMPTSAKERREEP